MSQGTEKSQLLALLKRDTKENQSAFYSVAVPSAFEHWRVIELKSECRRLGLVTSRPKKELVALLNNYYAKNNLVPPSAAETKAQSSVSVVEISESESSSSSSSGFEIVDTVRLSDMKNEMESLVESTANLDLNSRPTKPLLTPSTTSEERETAQVSELFSPHANFIDEPLCQTIMQDSKLYERVLQMEPISLDEFLGVARRAGVLTDSTSQNRANLRTWLDSQGICFYESEFVG